MAIRNEFTTSFKFQFNVESCWHTTLLCFSRSEFWVPLVDLSRSLPPLYFPLHFLCTYCSIIIKATMAKTNSNSITEFELNLQCCRLAANTIQNYNKNLSGSKKKEFAWKDIHNSFFTIIFALITEPSCLFFQNSRHIIHNWRSKYTFFKTQHFFQMLGYNTHEPKILCSLN